MKKILILIFLTLSFSSFAKSAEAPSDSLIDNYISSKKIYVGMGAKDFYNLIPDKRPCDVGFCGEGGKHPSRHFPNYALVGWKDYNVWDGGKGFYKIFVFERNVFKKKLSTMKLGTWKKYSSASSSELKFTNENKLVSIHDDFYSAVESLIKIGEPYAEFFMQDIVNHESKFKRVYGRWTASIDSRNLKNKSNSVKISASTKPQNIPVADIYNEHSSGGEIWRHNLDKNPGTLSGMKFKANTSCIKKGYDKGRIDETTSNNNDFVVYKFYCEKIVSESSKPNTAVTTNQADTVNINSKTKKLSETEIDEIINLRISNKPKEYSAAVIQEEKLRKEGWKGYDNNQIYIDRINREIFSDMVFNLGSECKTKFFGFFGNKVGSREYYNCIKFAYLKNPEILSKLNPDEKIINLKPKTFWAEFEKNKKLIIYLVIFLLVGSYIFKRIFVKTDIKTNKGKKLNNREIFQNKKITFSLPSFSFVNFINKIILKLKKIKFPGYLFKKHYFGYAITGVLIIIFVPVISNGPLSNLNPLNLISSGSNQYENIDPSTLSIEERRSYNCVKVFGFRKGSDKFKDCVFKIYQTELEIQKLETQKQLAEKELRIAEANAKAAAERARADQLAQQSAMERQEALLQQQSAAAQRQAAAAAAQARQAEIQSSLQMMQQGLQMMQPRSSPRLQTTCTNLGAFINCW